MEINYFGTIQLFKGYLVAFLGDTPAAGLAGGFKEGVGSARRCCRNCLVKNEELSLKVCTNGLNLLFTSTLLLLS